MINVDQAIDRIETAIPGLKVTHYSLREEDPKVFDMTLEFDGKIIKCEGHVTRFRAVDEAFIQKIRERVQNAE